MAEKTTKTTIPVEDETTGLVDADTAPTIVAGENTEGVEPIIVSYDFSGGNLGSNGVWVCDRCGGLVMDYHRERHSTWHSANGG